MPFCNIFGKASQEDDSVLSWIDRRKCLHENPIGHFPLVVTVMQYPRTPPEPGLCILISLTIDSDVKAEQPN